jgi:hypothetical protein
LTLLAVRVPKAQLVVPLPAVKLALAAVKPLGAVQVAPIKLPLLQKSTTRLWPAVVIGVKVTR